MFWTLGRVGGFLDCFFSYAVLSRKLAQLVTWILVIVVVFSIVYFFAVFAAELYVICGPSRATTEKIKNVAKADNSVTDVAMNPMFTSASLRV